MRRERVLPLAIVLLMLLVGVGVIWSRSATREPEAGPAPRAGAPTTGTPPAPEIAPLASAPETTKAGPEGSGLEPAAPAPVVDAPPRPADVSPSPTASDGGTVPPAVRRNPRDPPPPDPRSRPLGGGDRPPMGPTGQWEKFPPEMPSGRASIVVHVLDRDGKPISGASVLLGPPDIAGEAAVSYAHLRRLGLTDAEGRVAAQRLPEGAAAVAADVGGLMNGPRGLDATSGVRVTLAAGETARATLQLPLALGEMGSVGGVVRGGDGKPARGAQILCGFHREIADGAGRFTFAHVPAGPQRLSVQLGGHQPLSEPVEIEAGKALEVELDLVYQETGTLALRGSVTGPDGEPVPEATVYLIASVRGGSGTIRTVTTDSQGQYVMDALPDRLASTSVRLQANRSGYRPANVSFERGLTSSVVDLRLPARLVRLRLTVLDAASSEPQTRCRFEATLEGTGRPVASFSTRSETGVYEAGLEPGRYGLLVETPDHESVRETVEIPAGEVFEHTVRLTREREAGREVALTVVVTALSTGEPVEQAEVEVCSPKDGSAVASVAGRRQGGRFTLPAPSGDWRLRVSAPGFGTVEEDLHLAPDEPEVERAVALRPE